MTTPPILMSTFNNIIWLAKHRAEIEQALNSDSSEGSTSGLDESAVRTIVNEELDSRTLSSGLDEPAVRDLVEGVVAEHEQAYDHSAIGSGSGGSSQPTADDLTSGRVTVGADGDFQTVQAAWDAGEWGEPISIQVRDDYDPHAESYPIEMKRNGEDVFKPTALFGPGIVGPALGHPDVEGDVLDVLGAGARDYTRPFYAAHLRFEGGKKVDEGDGRKKGAGLAIADAPHTSLHGLLFNTEGDGLEVCAGQWGCFGLFASQSHAWNCGGDGFRTHSDAEPHNIQFSQCKAIANKGAGFKLSGGTCLGITQADIELNHGYGIEIRGRGLSVKDSYIEGNARAKDYPVEIYGREAHGLTVADNYFHGINPRGASHDHRRVQRAVNLHDSKSVAVRDNLFLRYGDRFFAGFGDSTYDLHPDSHYAIDAEVEGETETPLN